MSPTFMICIADFRDLCPVADFVANFPVHCNGLNFIRTTQTGLSRTLSQTSRHVEMVCVRDFHDLCRQLSPRGSFGESWHTGMWA